MKHDGMTMIARYDSKCPICNGEMPAGSYMKKQGDSWVHEECYMPIESDPREDWFDDGTGQVLR